MNDDYDDAGCWEFPSDVLVEIFQRLPTSSRRRFRLVCRLWRELVDDRTTEMQSRAKVLFWNAHKSVAYLVDDLSSSSTGSCTELWRWRQPDRNRFYYKGPQLVDTCNGILCLCDNTKMPGGAITLVNPATGEALPVPPLPCAGLLDERNKLNWWLYHPWHQAYTFGYHPISGRYKVVQVPSSFTDCCNLNVLQVHTVGEASWREVPAGPEGWAKCDRAAGIISVDGTTYWVIEDSTPRIVSFDLEHERVTALTPLPAQVKWSRYNPYHLTEVRGQLGFVVWGGVRTVDVWVLVKGRRWSRRYIVNHSLPRPNFVYGNYVLTREDSVYAHHKGPSLSGDVVWVSKQDQRTLVIKLEFGYSKYPGGSGTFAYVHTTEPLGVYATN